MRARHCVAVLISTLLPTSCVKSMTSFISTCMCSVFVLFSAFTVSAFPKFPSYHRYYYHLYWPVDCWVFLVINLINICTIMQMHFSCLHLQLRQKIGTNLTITMRNSSAGRASDWKARRNTDEGSNPRCGKGFVSHSQLSVQTLLRCPYSPLVQSHTLTSVRMLKISDTGSRTIVWTHENDTGMSG